jgi:hypothetical protein
MTAAATDAPSAAVVQLVTNSGQTIDMRLDVVADRTGLLAVLCDEDPSPRSARSRSAPRQCGR